MEQVIWIEVLSRQHEVAQRHRCVEAEITIGRGYDNRVVLDDPYVAPRHLRIGRDEEGRLVAEDLGSASGLHLGRERLARVVLAGAGPLRIGNTLLRIREPDHPVEPERLPAPPARTVWALPLGLAVAALGLRLLFQWLDETGQPDATAYLRATLVLLPGLLVWAGFWAVLSRVFSGQARFLRHLTIALAGLTGVTLVGAAESILTYALASAPIARFGFVATWTVSAVACFYHLRTISPTRLRLKAALMAALLFVGAAGQAVQQAGYGLIALQQTLARQLQPPALRALPLASEAAFYGRLDRLKARLDRDRQHEPHPAGFADLLDDGD